MMDIELIKPVYKYQKQEMYYTNEILVEPLEGISINEVIRKNGLEGFVKIKEGKFYSVIEIFAEYDACDIANKIQESGLVKYSHPNFIMPVEKHQVIPNDTYFNNQYYLRNTGQIFNPVENHFGLANADINASFAWNTTLGNNAIIVAVIDEGATPDHPDLPNTRQVRLNGSNFVPGENANDPTPGLHNNHGNACSGIIAATQNNNEGVTGIAPNVRIMPIKILGENNNADNNGVAAAIDFAWQNGAHVISNSWGYFSDDPNLVPAIVAAINRAVTQGRGGLGCVVAFAAGNQARHSVGVPGPVLFPSNVQINGVLTVGATDRNDQQADYSPTSNAASPDNQIIDIVAPSHRAYPPEAYPPGVVGGIPGEGFEVWTIDIPGNDGYNQWNNPFFPIVAPAFGEVLPTTGTNNLSYTGRMGGTSAACPQVAAVAALILSVNNNLTQQQVFDIITQSAEKVGGYTYNANGWCPELGNGRLNACAALSRIPNTFPITGPDRLCTTETYIIPGLPAGSTITWASSDNNIATISSNGVANRVGNGLVIFTATINIPNRCGVATSTIQVLVGTPTIQGYYIISSNYHQPIQRTLYNNNSPIWLPANQSFGVYAQITSSVPSPSWTRASNSYPFNWSSSGSTLNFSGSSGSTAYNQRNGIFNLTAQTVCGTETYTWPVIVQSWGSFRITTSPNPAKDMVILSISEESPEVQSLSKNENIIIEMYSFDQSRLIKQWRFKNEQTQFSLNVADIQKGHYIIVVKKGKFKESKQILIEK